MTATPGDPQIIAIEIRDPDQQDLLQDWIDVRAATQRHDLGAQGTPFTLAEYVAFADVPAWHKRVKAVVRHRPTDRLVGFSFVNLPAATPELAIQEDTLVLREHRGHGLGLRLRQATTAALLAERPRVRTIRTWNAVSNTPMLDVNRLLGYRPVAFECEWQKTLPA